MRVVELMERALVLAESGSATCMPNPMVGCVVVKDSQVVGEGFHATTGKAHAEAIALEQAGAQSAGADVYVTLEPCSHHGSTPPCTTGLIAAKVGQVFVALEDPDERVAGTGIALLRKAGIACETGMCAREARWQNRGYLMRKENGRPWVRLKTATSMDGRVALEDGTSQWITDKRSRSLNHTLRSKAGALLTGSGTALADDPQLNVRGIASTHQPLRVLIDGAQRCPAGLRMLKEQGAIVAVAGKQVTDYGSQAKVIELPQENERGKVDLLKLLEHLAAEHQINIVQAECGAGLAGALLKEDLVDEVAAFIAPAYLGSGISVSDFGGVRKLDQAPRFELRSARKLENDAMLTLQRKA